MTTIEGEAIPADAKWSQPKKRGSAPCSSVHPTIKWPARRSHSSRGSPGLPRAVSPRLAPLSATTKHLVGGAANPPERPRRTALVVLERVMPQVSGDEERVAAEPPSRRLPTHTKGVEVAFQPADRVLQPGDNFHRAPRMLAIQGATTPNALDKLRHIQPGATQG